MFVGIVAKTAVLQFSALKLEKKELGCHPNKATILAAS